MRGNQGQRKRRSRVWLVVCLLVIVIGVAAASCAAPASLNRAAAPAADASTAADSSASSTPPPTPTLSAGPTASASPTSSATPTPQPAATYTNTPSPTASPTLTATTRGPTPDGTARKVRVPILMYHYISDPPADADIYRKDLSLPPSRFESHLKYLKDNGYQTITLDELLDFLTTGKPLPEKPVILTFDDGYADNYANAFSAAPEIRHDRPLLHHHRFREREAC